MSQALAPKSTGFTFMDNYTPPPPPFAGQALSDLLAKIQFTVGVPASPSASKQWVHPPRDRNAGVATTPGFNQRVCEAAGLNWTDMLQASCTPRLHVPMTEELALKCSRPAIYSVTADTFSDYYYLEYIPELGNAPHRGRLISKYQRIIGSRVLGEVNASQQKACFDQLVAQAKAYRETADYAKVQQHAEAVRASIAARKAREAAESAKPVARPTAPPMAPVTSGKTPEAAVHAELQLLRAKGCEVLLPEQQLVHYAAIKRLLETAGGKYQSRKKSFKFEVEVDTAQVLAQLVAGESVNLKKDFQFFASTPSVVQCIQAWLPADLTGKDAMEPSAGDGVLADLCRDLGANVTTVELWDTNVRKLKEKGYQPYAQDFLSLTPETLGQFDYIVANPPFTKGQDIQHFQHMREFLKPGGTLVCVMSTSWQESKTRQAQAFRAWLESADVAIEQLPSGTFSESGTSVGAVVVRYCQAKQAQAMA